MFSTYAKIFILSFLCFTAITDLHAGGAEDDILAGTTTKKKEEYQVDEELLKNGTIGYSTRYKSTPVYIPGYSIKLDETKASLKAHADILNPDEALVWQVTEPIEGPLRDTFLKACLKRTWGYGILTIDDATSFASAEVISLMKAMKEIGLEVTLRGDLTQTREKPNKKRGELPQTGKISNRENKLLVVGIKKPALIEKSITTEQGSTSQPPFTPLPQIQRLKYLIPVKFKGSAVGNIVFEDFKSDSYPLEIELKVRSLEENDIAALTVLRNTASTPYDPDYAKSLETMMKEVQELTSYEQKSQKCVLRRSWKTYIKSLNPDQNPVVVFFSGHKGGHSGVGETDQSDLYFMVDSCEQFGDVEPDYMFYVPRTNSFEVSNEALKANIERRKGWSFWPSDSVSRVVLDDRRFMDYREFPEILRILKSGGTLEFPANAGMGFPTFSREHTNIFEIGLTGTNAWINPDLLIHFSRGADQDLRKSFYQEARNAAYNYFSRMGFSDVRWNPTHYTFELVK